MCKRLLTLLFIIGATYLIAPSQTALQKKYIRTCEYTNHNATSYENQNLPLKAKRLSNKVGEIKILYDETVPDSLKTAIEAARLLWEAQIPTKHPIYLYATFIPLDDNITVISEAGNVEDGDYRGYPSALVSQLTDYPHGDVNSVDGYIFFNSGISWNCNFTSDLSSGYNITTMALRGIARCLGFGSSIIEEEKDDFHFFYAGPTPFDNLLKVNGKLLAREEEGSLALAAAVKSDDVWVLTKSNNEFKVYAPDPFEPDVSLRYFDDEYSLMSYTLGQGNINLSIDDKTTDVLKSIGWDLPSSGLQIKCIDITDDGIGSSYSPHTFSLLKGNNNVTNYNWKFYLKGKTGDYTLISSGNTEIFTISAITSADNYFVNLNGDLEGIVECNYSLNGRQQDAEPFKLNLELKPSILSIDNISVNKIDNYGFYLLFNVNYTGADYVTVEVEEDYSTVVRNYKIYEPYIAHVKTGNITQLDYSWVTITVSNKYGKVYETLEFEPVYTSLNGNQASIKSVLTNRVYEIQIYSIDGHLVFKGTSEDLKKFQLQPGVYITRETQENGITKTSKKYVK